MKKIILILVTVLLLTSLAACGTKQTASSSDKADKSASGSSAQTETVNSTKTVVVPNVVGMNIDEAVKQLEDFGLKVESKTTNISLLLDESPVPQINQIISQTLTAGAICQKGTIITISYASDAPEFEYLTKQDNTICLVILSVYYTNNNTITIPNEYDGHKVSEIDLTNFQLGTEYTLRIPSNISIKGQTDCKIEKF